MLTRQLVRGALGFGAIGGGLALSAAVGPAGLLLLPVGLVALRGCPACWAAGLLSILRGRPASLGCAGGSCKGAATPTSRPIQDRANQEESWLHQEERPSTRMAPGERASA